MTIAESALARVEEMYGGTYEIHDPSDTSTVVGTQKGASAEDVDAAVAAGLEPNANGVG